jgi:hypothetical protein
MDQFDFFHRMIGWFQDWILLSDWFFPDLDAFGFFRIRIFLFPGQGLGVEFGWFFRISDFSVFLVWI